MITDSDVATLFQHIETYMSKYHPITENLPSQLFRGELTKFWEDQEPGGCERYMAIVEHFKVIPEYCFSCYKIVIEPRTVLELFKIMMLFEEIALPNNNVRKCMIELRQNIRGNYKAFVYSRSLDEATSLLETSSQLIDQQVGQGIPVIVKRGCSEFAAVNPDYPRVENGKIFLDYNPEWERIEKKAAEYITVETVEPATREADSIDSYTFNDYKVMLCWLMYAATISDKSYLQVSPIIRKPLQGINKSYP